MNSISKDLRQFFSGSYVVVDGSARKEALDSGNKVACLVSQVLFHDQVQVLRRSPDWYFSFSDPNFRNSLILVCRGLIQNHPRPQAFSDDSSNCSQRVPARVDSQGDEDVDSLPPLEENLNRSRPADFCSDSDSESSSS